MLPAEIVLPHCQFLLCNGNEAEECCPYAALEGQVCLMQLLRDSLRHRWISLTFPTSHLSAKKTSNNYCSP